MTRRRIGILLLLLSLLPIGGALWLAREPWRLTMQAERVTGRVTEIVRVAPGGRVEHRPVIAYTPADGRRRTIMAPPLSTHPGGNERRPPGQNIGDRVEVLHDPATGQGALPGATGVWVLPLAVAGHGLVLLALPGAVLAWPRRGEGRGWLLRPGERPWRRVLLAGAVGCFAMGGWLVWDSVSALRNDRMVFGTVVSMTSAGRNIVAPRIRWTENGRPQEFRGQGRLALIWGLKEGDALNLLIKPDRPDRIRPVTFFDLWLFPAIWMAAGLVLLLVRRLLRAPPAEGRARLILPPSEVQRRIARGEPVTEIRRAFRPGDR